jgi:hypothetical protein
MTVGMQYRRMLNRFAVALSLLSGLGALACTDSGGLRGNVADAARADLGASDTQGIGSGQAIDSRPSVLCQSTCDNYCVDGHVLDSNGCLTCACKAAPPCLITACIPQDCPFGQQLDKNSCLLCVCAAGLCRDWTTEAECEQHRGNCRWLKPGCGTPALAVTGCYDLSEMNCSLTGRCPDGKTCQRWMTDPCNNGSDCNTCGQMVSICM